MSKFYTEKSHIESWLHKNGIRKYLLIESPQYGYQVNVDGDVNLKGKQISFIPVKFNHVSGSFYCGHNNLTSLEGVPRKVGRDFSCNNNRLTNLNFSPKVVQGSYYCQENKIVDLTEMPKIIQQNFDCSHNKLASLVNGPGSVRNNFNCSHNELNSLESFPLLVKGTINCQSNPMLEHIQSMTKFKEIKVEINKVKKIVDFKEKIERILVVSDEKSQRIKI